MKIETPPVQADPNVELFYVSSESNPDDKGKQYIVVHHKNHDQFYCDCRDFIVRHLPKVLSGETSHCKHGDFVKDISSFAGSKYRLVSADDLQGTAIFEVSKPKKFGVFARLKRRPEYDWRSNAITGEFPSFAAAEQAMKDHGTTPGGVERFVKELK